MNSTAADLAPLVSALAHLELDDGSGLDARDICDALWLAAVRDGPASPAAVEDAAEESSGTDIEQAGAADQEPSTAAATGETGPHRVMEGEPAVEVYEPGDGDGEEEQVVPARRVRLPAPAAITNEQALARALRAFRQTRPSARRRILDVEATAEATATARCLAPVLVPAEERRFSLDVVVDTAPSMAVWRPAIAALTRLIEQQVGAFSRVTVWELEVDDDGVRLRDSAGAVRSATHVQPTDGRSVVLVATDMVGARWRDEAPWHCLRTWATSAPVAILDPLPVKLWRHTAVGPDRVLAHAATAATANTRLRFDVPRRWRPARRPHGDLLPIPVVGFHPRGFDAWTGLVVHAREPGCVALLHSPKAHEPEPDERGEIDDATRVRNFTQLATPFALRLATLAAITPQTTLAVLRALQEELLPEASTSDLAEVLISGMLDDIAGPEGDVGVRFREGCRSRLLEQVGMQDRWDVYQALTRAIARSQPSRSPGFDAAILDPEGPNTIPATLEPFAEMSRTALAGIKPPAQGPDYLSNHVEPVAEMSRSALAGRVIPGHSPRPGGSDLPRTSSGSSAPIELPWLLRTWRTLVTGRTQREVSRQIFQSSHTTLSEWERGVSPVPVERLRDLDEAYAAGGALVDLAMALGTPKALPPRTVWTHNFSDSGGPVWTWLRPEPGAGRVTAVARWGAFAYDCVEVCDDRGIFCTLRTSMTNPALWVELPAPGWVDFGEGELPPELGLRQVDAMSASRVVSDGHSTAGLVAPPIVERFLSDATFADAVLRFFGQNPDVVRAIFSTRRGWDRIDDLTDSGPRRPLPVVGPHFTGEQYRTLREGRGLSRNDAARAATELLSDDRDRRGRVRKVTSENIHGVEDGRTQRSRYLYSRLDRVYRADGRTGTEAVEPERRGDAHVFDFPEFWVGPVWFAIEASDDRPAVVRIDCHGIHKEIRVAGRVVVTCRQADGARYPFVLSCPTGWRVTGGMGLMPGAEDVNFGWHRKAGPEREGTINEHLLEAFGRTMGDWNDLLRQHSRRPRP